VSDKALTWEDVICKVEGLRSLPDDWDGMGAAKPSPAAIDRTMQLCRFFAAFGWTLPFRVVPSPAGTVGFEWQGDDGQGRYYREIEVNTDGTADWMVVDENNHAEHGGLDQVEAQSP